MTNDAAIAREITRLAAVSWLIDHTHRRELEALGIRPISYEEYEKKIREQLGVSSTSNRRESDGAASGLPKASGGGM